MPISMVEMQSPENMQQTWHACSAAEHSHCSAPRAMQMVPLQVWGKKSGKKTAKFWTKHEINTVCNQYAGGWKQLWLYTNMSL